MKTPIHTFLLAMLLATHSSARLGEDLTQLRARYGVETVVTMDGAGSGAAVFRKAGLEITCDLTAGKTRLITVRPLDPAKPITPADAAKLVAANQASASDPLTIVTTDPATGYTAWQDKAETRTAVYRPDSKNTPLIIFLDPPEDPEPAPPARNLDGF